LRINITEEFAQQPIKKFVQKEGLEARKIGEGNATVDNDATDLLSAIYE
jgi:hypothetical protein